MKWISIQDKLPPIDERFIGFGNSMCMKCKSDKPSIEMCSYENSPKKYVFGEWCCEINISSWMPLPDHPI